jgi:hypothetical protein
LEVGLWLTGSGSGRMRLLSHGRLAGPQLRWGREKLDATTVHSSALVLFIDVSCRDFQNTQVR